MRDHYHNNNSGSELAQAPTIDTLSIVQHNCLGSWNMFLSPVNCLKATASLLSFVLLQDSHVFRNRLSSFVGFKAFASEIHAGIASKVECYVFYGFLQTFPIIPLFFKSADWMAFDVHTPSGLFDSNSHVLRIYNGYSTNGSSSNVRTIVPEKMFTEHNFPCLVVGDFNIHTPLSNPLYDFSPKDISTSTPYF